MAMEIAAKEIKFDSSPIIDLRHWIESQCLSHNFPRSISKRIKTQVERIAIPPYMCIISKIYFTLREEKKRKLPEMKVWMVKTVRRFFFFFFVVLYYNELVVGFQRLIATCEKQILRFLINMQEIYFFRICCKKINTWTSIVDDGGPICLSPKKRF